MYIYVCVYICVCLFSETYSDIQGNWEMLRLLTVAIKPLQSFKGLRVCHYGQGKEVKNQRKLACIPGSSNNELHSCRHKTSPPFVTGYSDSFQIKDHE
jgi:hypothetical protein